MKIVTVMETSIRNTTVFLSYIQIPAVSIEDAMAKYNGWDQKRSQSEAFVLCDFEQIPEIVRCGGNSDETITLEAFEQWRKVMLNSFEVDGEATPAVWQYVH